MRVKRLAPARRSEEERTITVERAKSLGAGLAPQTVNGLGG